MAGSIGPIGVPCSSGQNQPKGSLSRLQRASRDLGCSRGRLLHSGNVRPPPRNMASGSRRSKSFFFAHHCVPDLLPQSQLECFTRIGTRACRPHDGRMGVDAIGTNCSMGPKGILDIVERIAACTDIPIVAMPNAGMPQTVEGRTLYLASPEYMAEYARRLAQKGANGVGGCCGTTPEMIKEMRVFLRSISPIHEVDPITACESSIDESSESQSGNEPVPITERSEFAKRVYSDRFTVSVELIPPGEYTLVMRWRVQPCCIGQESMSSILRTGHVPSRVWDPPLCPNSFDNGSHPWKLWFIIAAETAIYWVSKWTFWGRMRCSYGTSWPSLATP